MFYKPFFLIVMICCFLGIDQSYARGSDADDEIVALEEAIVAADIETAYCQRETGWHFPASFYNHIYKAKKYSAIRKNGKAAKKTCQTLQGLLGAIDETLEGVDGYWAGELVWIDPVPPAPACVHPVMEALKVKVETLMASFQ